jgi:hypothetical protein
MPNIVDGDDGLVFSMGRWALKSRASKYIFVLAFFLTCFAFGAALGIVLAALHLSFFLTAPVALGFWVLLARSNVLIGRCLFVSEDRIVFVAVSLFRHRILRILFDESPPNGRFERWEAGDFLGARGLVYQHAPKPPVYLHTSRRELGRAMQWLAENFGAARPDLV